MIKPLNDMVLLEEILPPKEVAGIVLTGNEDIEPTKKARVVKIGNKARNFAEFVEDDVVIYRPHLFEEVVFEKKTYLLGKAEHVVAITYD